MMRKRTVGLALLFLLLNVFVAVACGRQEKPTEELDDGTSGFSFEFSHWVNPEQKNIWSTEKKRIQKDLVFDGVAGADWTITKKDLAEVESLIREYQVTQMKEEIDQYLATAETFSFEYPDTIFELSFFLDGQRYSVSFPFGVLKGIPKDDSRYKYNEFFDKLFAILEGQGVYKNLPESSGGYN